MKRTLFRSSFALVLSFAFTTLGAAPHRETTPEARPWEVVNRDAHENLWESVTLTTNPITQKVYAQKHSSIELATGLNLLNLEGSWTPA